MATIRLANGGDLGIKLSLEEVKGALGGGADFVELPGADGPVLIRPAAVIVIIEDSKRGTAGFRVGAAAAG